MATAAVLHKSGLDAPLRTMIAAHGPHGFGSACRRWLPARRLADVAKTVSAGRDSAAIHQPAISCKPMRAEGLRLCRGIHVHALASRQKIATCNVPAAAA
jgi:hypothetical protein